MPRIHTDLEFDTDLPARPSAGTKSPSRQDAKSAKKAKSDQCLSLGDLGVFARDIIRSFLETCVVHSELSGNVFQLWRVSKADFSWIVGPGSAFGQNAGICLFLRPRRSCGFGARNPEQLRLHRFHNRVSKKQAGFQDLDPDQLAFVIQLFPHSLPYNAIEQPIVVCTRISFGRR